jgi:hypothetical protein
MGRMHLFSTGGTVRRAPATRSCPFYDSRDLLVRKASNARGLAIGVARDFRKNAGSNVLAIVMFSFNHRGCSRLHSRMRVEGSNVDGVPKAVWWCGAGGPIRIYAPRRSGRPKIKGSQGSKLWLIGADTGARGAMKSLDPTLRVSGIHLQIQTLFGI